MILIIFSLLYLSLLLCVLAARATVRWGTKGFSLNVNFSDVYVAFLMGFSLSSAFPQTIYVNLDIIEKKVEKGKETSEVFKKRFIETGLFIPAGEKQIKYRVHQEISNAQIEEFTALLSELATEIREKRLKEAE